MNKKLALILSILVTLIGTFIVGLYDYNIYYNPEESHGQDTTSKYKEYLVDKTFVALDDLVEQTENKIKLNEMFNNNYYNSEPILKEDVYSKDGEKKLFTVAIYKNVAKYAPSTDVTEWKYRFNTYIYDVNYENIKTLFMSQSVPQDKNIIKDSGYPVFLLNIYPNNDYNDDESFYYKSGSVISDITLNDGDEILRQKPNSTTSFTLNDYNSTPSLNDDEEPFNVQFLSFNAYPNASDNISLFTDKAYLKIDLVMETKDGDKEVNYLLKDDKYSFEKEITNFNINEEINLDDYEEGYNNSANVREVLNSVKIDGVMKYDTWVFATYIWWQCLICLVVLGLIVGGFFYALTVDANKVSKSRKKK